MFCEPTSTVILVNISLYDNTFSLFVLEYILISLKLSTPWNKVSDKNIYSFIPKTLLNAQQVGARHCVCSGSRALSWHRPGFSKLTVAPCEVLLQTAFHRLASMSHSVLMVCWQVPLTQLILKNFFLFPQRPCLSVILSPTSSLFVICLFLHSQNARSAPS